MNLALKYRPREFSDMVGQRAICVMLEAMIEKGILDQVLLFTGPSGVGKTSMARIIAAQLNSEGATDVHEGTHPAILEIDAASSGSVAALRQLKQDLSYTIMGHRVIILDEAHAISDEGKAVLLNMLEFPPKNVTFILITTEAHEIPVTVRHRCDTYVFKKASVADISARIEDVARREGISIDSELINVIAQRSEGSFRESMMLLKQVWAGAITSVSEYNILHGEQDYGPILLKSALAGPERGLKELENALYLTTSEDISSKIIETLRDMMLLKGKNELDFVGQALDARTQLAAELNSVQILKCMRIMWDLQTKLGSNDPVRGLELAYAMICETIGRSASAELANSSVQAHIQQRNSERMTFAQMQNRKV